MSAPVLAPRAGAPATFTLCTKRQLTSNLHASIRRGRQHKSKLLVANADADRAATTSTIENLSTDYCDDFECKSSPAVESTVRSLAKDIERCNGIWTTNLFSRNVEYSDSYRKFSGKDGYKRLNFIQLYVQSPSAKVRRMRMEGNAVAVINWVLTGSVGPLPIKINYETQITLNLVTGQVEKHQESWSFKECSPPGALAWTLSRLAWSATMASEDTKQAGQKILESFSGSDDEDEGNWTTMRDPSDPTKFFQQQDNFQQDAIMLMGGVALLWTIWKGFATLFNG